jgi:hypothetical protein
MRFCFSTQFTITELGCTSTIMGLAEKFIAERLRRGLNVRTVAKLAGYTRRIAKGIRRIEHFERDGTGNPQFIERIFSAIGLNLFVVQQEIMFESVEREERKVATWLRQNRDAAIAKRLAIRCFSGVYSTTELPDWIATSAEAVIWSKSFARRHGVCVCLPLTPRLFLFLDSTGRIQWLREN